MKLFKNFYTEQKRKELVKQINSLFISSLNEQEIEFDKTLAHLFKKIGNQNQIAEFLFDQFDPQWRLEIKGEIKNVEMVYAHPTKPDFLELHFTKPNGSRAKSEMKVGKFITALVKEMNHRNLKPKPQEIEHFVKLIYAERTGDVEDLYEFRLVSGKDIKKYYHFLKSECLAGGLGASCMKYDSTQEYVEFYTELDPKQCSLLIRVNPVTDKIVGRALLWKLDSGKMYLDRIYVSDNKDALLFHDYAEKKYKIDNSFDVKSIRTIQTVTIKNWKMRKTMPYMDTFWSAIIVNDDLILYTGTDLNTINKMKEDYPNYDFHLTLRQTDGGFKKTINPNNASKNSQSFLQNAQLIDDLTIEKLTEKQPWILECEIENAVISLNRHGDIIWHKGKFLSGEWEDGTWLNGTWYNGTWKNGTWEKGEWKDGTWKNGTWENGQWYGGTWEDGNWENGSWYGGRWQSGIWENGTWKNGGWKSGTWKSGTWEDGTWLDGTWMEGEWNNGTWYNGFWRKGIWKKGEWKNGVWQGGSWEDGRWIKGEFNGGTWYSGTWEDGEHNNGTWYNGTWKHGVWQGGSWESGTWNDGIWFGGKWKNGTWKNGMWKKGNWDDGFWFGGTWEYGRWNDGVWQGGTWEDGEWLNGTWQKGIWKNGKWKGGDWEDPKHPHPNER